MALPDKMACFTGHRELKESPEFLFHKVLEKTEQLIRQGYVYFAAGGARGFDAIAAQAVLKLEEKYPHIRLILVLPFPRPYVREGGWTQEDIRRHEEQKKRASQVIYTRKAYGVGCYYQRNRYLVDFSSVCLCYQYKNTGGTAYTVSYAKEKGRKIIPI